MTPAAAKATIRAMGLRMVGEPGRLVTPAAARADELDQLGAGRRLAQPDQADSAEVDELAVALEAQLAGGIRLAPFAFIDLAPQRLKVHGGI